MSFLFLQGASLGTPCWQRLSQWPGKCTRIFLSWKPVPLRELLTWSHFTYTSIELANEIADEDDQLCFLAWFSLRASPPNWWLCKLSLSKSCPDQVSFFFPSSKWIWAQILDRVSPCDRQKPLINTRGTKKESDPDDCPLAVTAGQQQKQVLMMCLFCAKHYARYSGYKSDKT